MSDFLNILTDIKQNKYPDIVEKHSEILEAKVLTDNNLNATSQKADEVSQKADEVSQKADEVSQKADEVSQKADEVSQKADEVNGSAVLASQKADEARDIRDELTAIKPKVVTLNSNETPSLSYDKKTGNYTLYMPKGLKGDRGEAFNVDASGTLAERAVYDGASKGFAYLTLDANPTTVSFKATDTSGDWTAGVAFGKGDKGATGDIGISVVNIVFTSTTDVSGEAGKSGATDTYTTTLSDTTTRTHVVYNGKDMTNATAINHIEELLFDMKLGLPI